MAFDTLQELFSRPFYSAFICEQYGDAIRITGRKTKNNELVGFMSMIKNSIWETVSGTKIILRNMVVDIDDRSTFGDRFCFYWMKDFFGKNIEFDNCFEVQRDVKGLDDQYACHYFVCTGISARYGVVGDLLWTNDYV